MFRSVLLVSLIASNLCLAKTFEEQYGKYKLGNTYRIGKSVITPTEVNEYSEKGIASWYNGTKYSTLTANGATFDKSLYFVAHRTLPMPSIVMIENLENGKKVYGVVADRGPFNMQRLVDVSQQIATDLGFISSGVAKVKINYMKEESEKARRGEDMSYLWQSTPTAVEQPKVVVPAVPVATASQGHSNCITGEEGFYVQVGTYTSVKTATDVYKTFAADNPAELKFSGGKHHVRTGPFQNKTEAKNQLDKATEMGYKDALIIEIK